MASLKREADDGGPDSSKTGKKVKLHDDDPRPLTLKAKASKFQGCDDNDMRDVFEKLSSSISNFALEHFKGAPYATPRKKDQKIFERLVANDDFRAYLTSKQRGAKPWIIQAVIWNKLIDQLLLTPTKAQVTMMYYERIFLISIHTDAPEEFYAWRTLTANLLSNYCKDPTSWGESGPRREEFLEEMVALLLDHAVERDPEALNEGLNEIADNAFELAKAMACCRAFWLCTMKDPRINSLHDFRIKTDSMEEVELWNEEGAYSKSVIVDLVAAPMLLKNGNSKGANYGTFHVFKKAQVITKAKGDEDEIVDLDGDDGDVWKEGIKGRRTA
ncbi:hypothetical protein SLS64_010238 [Diaporthe eres]